MVFQLDTGNSTRVCLSDKFLSVAFQNAASPGAHRTRAGVKWVAFGLVTADSSHKMINDEGELVDLYLPRKW
jgi:hypothetical protein